MIVDRDIDADVAQIRVQDTHKALIAAGQFYRAQFNIPVVGITGSCGKTTTRALLESILRKGGKECLASQKSFNNNIGLPLTLTQLSAEHEAAVLEIGTNHPGEIAALTNIAKPTIAVVTMAAPAHTAFFSSISDITKEKGAIFENLSPDGIAVINADDFFSAAWKLQATGHSMMTFGQKNKSDVMAKEVRLNKKGQPTFTLTVPGASADIILPLLGKYNVTNALAAAACAHALGLSIHDIQSGLQTAVPVAGRMIEKQAANGAVILDDSYNANPVAVKAAIDLLAHRSSQAIFVFGDMGELGKDSEKLHAEIGAYAKAAGIAQLFCLGKNSAFAAEAFGKDAQHFVKHQALGDQLKLQAGGNTTVLVKGSRSMRLEIVVEALLL